MDKWEYKISYYVSDINSMNSNGRDGWELVSATSTTLYYKRKIKPIKE